MFFRLGCSSLTYYVCLSCKKFVCNKLKNCFVFISEVIIRWKVGVLVGYCVDCFNKANSVIFEEKVKGIKVKIDKILGIKEEIYSVRKCFTFG